MVSKRIMCLVISTVLALVGCQRQPTGTETAPTESIKPSDNPQQAQETYEVKDFDYRYSGFAGIYSFAEADNLYVGIGLFDSFLRYYDKITGESGVLCGKPECLHNDDSCGGLIFRLSKGLCLYDGKLYWVGGNREAEGGGSGTEAYTPGVYCMKTDGTGRKKISSEAFESFIRSHKTLSCYFHRDYLYLLTVKDIVSEGAPSQRYELFRTAVGEFSEYLSVFEYETLYASELKLFFVESRVYINIYSDKEDTVCLLDLDTLSFDTVMTEKDLDLYIYDVQYFSETLYFTGYDDEKNYVLCMRNGRLEKLFDYVDGEKSYDGAVLGSGIACALYYNGDNAYDIWFRTFDGETLYKGPWDLGLISEDPGFDFMGVYRIGGNESFLILCVEFKENGKDRYCFIKHEFNNGKLIQSVLLRGETSLGI